MAKFTRFSASDEPLNIFQDDFFENATSFVGGHASMPSTTRQAKRPLGNSSTNVILNPPNAHATRQSPSKSRMSTSPLSPLKASQGSKLNTISMMPPSARGRPTDSLQKKQPFLSKFKTVAQKPVVDAGNYGKENIHPTIFPAPTAINLSIDSFYPQKVSGKRVLLEAAPIAEGRPAKKLKTEDSQAPVIPPHDSFPPIKDNGTKPGHSYAMLIGMAILRSPNRRLTLSQIYKWISDTFCFYNPNDAGWQNSIRHNLSLHKEFIKVERPKDDPGKGHYWTIQEGQEILFLSQKPTRKTASAAETLPVIYTHLEPKPSHEATMETPYPHSAPAGQSTLPPLPVSQEMTAIAPELSSDATIPISDMAVPEESFEKMGEPDSLEPAYSPLPIAMHSSPPIPRHVEARSGTPPPMARVPASSNSRSRKRKFTSMDDSGYISSLESSVMRPNQKAASLLTSEADRPRIKRGRAEEEIARLRASSYDSPTKNRSWNGFAPPSSSPLRQINESNQMLPPLTPAVKLKAPPRPPPSVSPNTNLRNHRDRVRHMLQSPLRRMTGAGDEHMPWSPAFHLDDSLYLGDDFAMNSSNAFDIFDESLFSAPAADSPIKRSAKRARVERSHSATALGDITNSASNKSSTSSNFLKIPDQSFGLYYETPSKTLEGLPSPGKMFSTPTPSKHSQNIAHVPACGDWPALTFDVNDFINPEEPSLDILQGFEKIGSGPLGQKPAKPAFGRSYSTAF